MNGTSIQKFLTGSTWCKTAQNVPSHRPPLLVLQKILGNICFSEQIFYRKQSLGAPVYIIVLNSPNAPLYLHQAMQTQRTCTICGPWSATFQKMIKYFVEKKNTLNKEISRDLQISILSYDEVLAFLLWVKMRN